MLFHRHWFYTVKMCLVLFSIDFGNLILAFEYFVVLSTDFKKLILDFLDPKELKIKSRSQYAFGF